MCYVHRVRRATYGAVLVELGKGGLEDAMLAKMSGRPREERVPDLLLQLRNAHLELELLELRTVRAGDACMSFRSHLCMIFAKVIGADRVHMHDNVHMCAHLFGRVLRLVISAALAHGLSRPDAQILGRKAVLNVVQHGCVHVPLGVHR